MTDAVLPSERLVRVAEALSRFFTVGGHGQVMLIRAARAAVEAMKYEDADEGDLIEVSNAQRVEAVTLIEAYDAMLTATLKDRRRPSPEPDLGPDGERLRSMLEAMTGGPIRFVTVPAEK